ncbi:MAG: hypothetical protein COW71_12110 [Ignavibacteriales bacterium CG18_big_fil_WC_8_21_14_2_50_31_20]|nr:MAG: hypothetical protein COW71_12110 [Ignavibacteriales bacterium CG18_big_fil_WC_8_21_14_2_50_31_20]
MVKKQALRILFVEDSETDMFIAEKVIKNAGILFISKRVETEEGLLKEINEFNPDIIISDYSMPSFDGMTALKLSLKLNNNLPFIILTGSINEETAVNCMKAGADDYILKDNLHRLVSAIESSLLKHKNIKAKIIAENALKQSESRFKNLFTENLAVMLLIDPETLTIIDANFAAEKFYGWTIAELKNMKITDINTLQEKELSIIIAKFFNSERKNFEFKHKKANGLICDVEVFLSKLNFGGKTYIHTIVHEITKRKKAENELKTAARVFEHSIDMICVAGFDGYFKVLNPSWERTLGWPTKELLSKPWVSFVHPDDRKITENIKSVIINGQTIFQFENRYICKDGSAKWLSWNTFPYKDEEIMYGVARDVTENKEQREKLRTLSRAVEQSPVSIIITDPEGFIKYANPKTTEVTGYEFKELYGNNPRIFKSGEQSNDFYDKLWGKILSGKRWQGELHNKKKNGDLFWENAIISPIVNSNGDIINFVAVKEDITEKKAMLEELILAKERAEDINRVKSLFLSNMSHELRTPFVGIMGYAELLTESLTDPNDKEMAEGILSTSKRMLTTLTEILNIVKFESEQHEKRITTINIQNLIESINRDFKESALLKNIKFEFKINVENLFINSDESLVSEALRMLVSNAIKFTEKGKVQIIVDKINKADKNYLTISVLDTGIGIAKDKQEIIWQEFRQVEEGISRNYQGTGLGLTIAKRSIEILGGKIFLESEFGKGSVFTIEIPFNELLETENVFNTKYKYATLDKNGLTKLNSLSSKRKIILNIEDDLLTIKIIKRALKEIYDIDSATNAIIALEKIKNFQFDAILMDINLGSGLNGVELTQKIRLIPNYKETPIIALTTFASDYDKLNFLSKGVSHYLAKPFMMKDLLKILDEIFRNG